MSESADQPSGLDALGLTFASFSALGLENGLKAARLATELGYRSFWTAETMGLESFAVLAAAGAVAPSMDLGTGIMPIQIRTPGVAAMGAATLQALHPEREILLGIGVSTPAIVSRWHGARWSDRPLAQMREYLTIVAAMLEGDSVSFAGDHYELDRFRLGVRLGDRRPRTVLAALNPKMLALAGELADGVLLNYIPASHVPWSIEQVRAGEAAAGRPPGTCRIYAYVHAGLCDPEAARRNAQRDLYGYAMADGYAKNFIRAGYGDEIAQIRDRAAVKDRDGAIAAVSDRMIADIDTVGDAATVRQTVENYVAAGVDVPVLMPLPWGENRWASLEDTMRAAIASA